MRKKALIIILVLVLVILLFPVRLQLKDGGSIRYKSLTYSITNVHSLVSEAEAKKDGKVKPYNDGIIVEILGMKVFDNVE